MQFTRSEYHYLTNEVSHRTDALNLPKFLAVEPDTEIAKIKHSVMKLINFEMAAEHHLCRAETEMTKMVACQEF